MRRLVILIAGLGAGLIALSFGLGGQAPLGRLLLSLGLPGPAIHQFDSPDWRGYAAARAGQTELARATLAQAESWLNLGNYEAQNDNFAAALEAYDRGRVAGDPDAAANYDLMVSYYAALGIDADSLIDWHEDREGEVDDAPIGEGDGRAAGDGDNVNNAQTALGLLEVETDGLRSVRKVFDDAYVIADERWLATLQDVPGQFLAARLREEQKRRDALAEAAQ